MDKIRLLITEDGSHTLYLEELNEPYHSTYGAINESNHVFIEAGLNHLESSDDINVFEMGFGTGLNAFLSAIYAFENQKKLTYYGLEAYPPSADVIFSLNYPLIVDHSEAKEIFHKIHSEANNIKVHPYFNLKKLNEKMEDIHLPSNFFTLVYFDAFNPDLQPELWTEKIFLKIFRSMKEGGILTTYSCKGNVKRALKSVGFTIEKIPGPKGKREMLRAQKNK